MNPKPSYDAMSMTSPLCRRDGQAIPLLSSRLEGELVGGLVRLISKQHYKNAEAQPIEAIYTFPLPTHATVCGFVMTVEGRRIEAVIEEREEAFRRYDDAITDGHGAALLEQERPNVFTANVGNLLPGEDVSIEIEFVMPLRADEGVLRLFVPTLVAPRYIPGAPTGARTSHGAASPTGAVPDADRISPPIGAATYKLDISLRVHADAKAKISSPSHAVSSAHDGAAWTCTVSQADLDRDFVLLVEPTEVHGLERIVAHREGENAGYVALTWTPMLPAVRDASPSVTTFVLDRSGSMQGASMEQAKLALRLCLRQLREGDRFQLIAFDNAVESLRPEPVVFSESTLRTADQWLEGIDARGGTELLAPLTMAASVGGLVVLLTDGQVGNEDQVLAAVLKQSQGARIHSFGIGTNVSDALLSELARRTQGGLEMIYPGERIDGSVTGFPFGKVIATFAKARARRVRNVQLETDGVALDELAPSALPDIVEGEPWAVLARYAAGDRTQVKLSGELDGKPFMHVWPCELPARADAPAVRLFWARERVRDLESREVTGRHAEAMKERIVRIAKEHGIASRYTSFLVVEKRTGARRQQGPAETRVVPVNAPAGWAKGQALGFADEDESTVDFMRIDPMSIDPMESRKRKKSAPKAAVASRSAGAAPVVQGRAMESRMAAPRPAPAMMPGAPPPPPAAAPSPMRARHESMAKASFEKESADAGDSLWMSQLASGLWDADASLAKTLVQLRVLVRDGVTTSHAVYGGNVRKAIEAVARAASLATLPLSEREEALLLAFLLADGPASRRVVTDAAAQLSAALVTRMQSADLKATLGL